jgi:hydroxyacylglutathione hydrolase
MHAREKDWLEKSLKPLPPGVTLWGKIFTKIMAVFMPFVHIPATNVDVILGDEEFPLNEFGISGKIIFTPGHSPGSVSLLLDTGEAFVGDLAMNAFPLRLSPGLPIFAEDLHKVRDSWELLLDRGAKTIYPAHGNSFSAEIIRDAF